jgi:hypothetical protein
MPSGASIPESGLAKKWETDTALRDAPSLLAYVDENLAVQAKFAVHCRYPVLTRLAANFDSHALGSRLERRPRLKIIRLTKIIVKIPLKNNFLKKGTGD